MPSKNEDSDLSPRLERQRALENARAAWGVEKRQQERDLSAVLLDICRAGIVFGPGSPRTRLSTHRVLPEASSASGRKSASARSSHAVEQEETS